MAVTEKRWTVKDFQGAQPTWCPGCGDFGVLRALQQAAVNLGIAPHEMVLVSGIGCSGKIAQYFGSYGFHGVHGRTLPVATAIKLANRNLTVVAAGGDGDGYGIGIGHLLHAIRRNVDITYIVMDNHIYGLTTGQASPTSDKGHVTKTSPQGTAEDPIRPLQTAIGAGATFVAQGFSGDVKHLATLFERAIRHRGFALVNVFSPCVTFNHVNTYDYYKQRLVNLDEDPTYDRRNRAEAIRRLYQHDGLVVGVVFEDPSRPPYEDELPGFAREPLARQDLHLPRERFEELVAQHY